MPLPFPPGAGHTVNSTCQKPIIAACPRPPRRRIGRQTEFFAVPVATTAHWFKSEMRVRGEAGDGRMIVRGGSWRDRPHRATSSFRLDYRPYHKVFNVGFRVIVEAE